MARRSGEGGGMSAGPMNTIIAGFVGLLVIVAIVILGPVLAGSIQSAVPAMPVGSDWNATENTDLPSGVDIWQTNVVLGGIVIQMLCLRKNEISKLVRDASCRLSNVVKSSSSLHSQFMQSSKYNSMYIPCS
jgi:hypothetical protein